MDDETRDSIDDAMNVPRLVEMGSLALIRSTEETDFGVQWEEEVRALVLRIIERARSI